MSLISDFKTLRAIEQECISNPLHDDDPKSKTFFPCLKYCEGPGVPAYFHPERCQVLLVMEHPDEEEVRRDAKLRAPFTGKAGRLLSKAMREAKLNGDDRIGFTTMIKCRLKNRRSPKKVYEQCVPVFLDEEIAYARPILVVCFGEVVARYLCPEAFPSDPSQTVYFGQYLGKTFTSLDRTFMFLHDLDSFMGADGNVKDSQQVVFKYEFVGYLGYIKDWLQEPGDYLKLAGYDSDEI